MKVIAVLVIGLALWPALPARAQAPSPARPPRPAPAKPESPPPARPDARAMLRVLEDAFSAVADRVTPAVVNVSTVAQKSSTNGDDDRQRELFGDDLDERYFRRRPRDDGRASG